MTLLLLALGVALLVLGGDLMVRGAGGIAKRAGISPAVIGMTVVAFGTSAPELVVSMIGALQDKSAVAFGNVVGSNLANLGLVLALTAIIKPLTLQGQLIKREVPFLLLATSIIMVMAADRVLQNDLPQLSRSEGITLLLMFTIFVYVNVRDFLRERNQDVLVASAEHTPLALAPASNGINATFIIAGMLGLFFGGDLTVNNAIVVAQNWDLPEVVVGLGIVAIGTSLPELATSIIAALRGEPDLALGNVVGSNIFNVLFVMPIGAIMAPMGVPDGGLGDLFLGLVFTSLLLAWALWRKSIISRRSGFLLLCAYVTYMGWRFL